MAKEAKGRGLHAAWRLGASTTTVPTRCRGLRARHGAYPLPRASSAAVGASALPIHGAGEAI